MIVEEIIYEISSPLPGLGAAVFITVLHPDFSAGRLTRESHVFFPRREVHLHEIGFEVCRADDVDALFGRAVRATHHLLARHVAALATGDRWQAGATFAYESTPRGEHPFFEFRLAGCFRDALWEIQDWTISSSLRSALAQVTGYRVDYHEAELLARVFASGEAVALPKAG